jgi:hypothetical protein
VTHQQVSIKEMRGVLQDTFGIGLDDSAADTLVDFLEQASAAREEPA